jgi:hypothetical protein
MDILKVVLVVRLSRATAKVTRTIHGTILAQQMNFDGLVGMNA